MKRIVGNFIVAVLLAACSSIGTAREAAGTYEATLPAASSGERHVAVTLDRDGTAAVTSAFSGRPSRFMVKGTWRREGDRVTLDLGGARPERMVFDQGADRLVAREWDRSTWGESGPGTLQRVR
jgi:hypothetical protein